MLLTSGFLDERGWVKEVLTNGKYLVLGPKGSGKSALLTHIDLTSDDVHDGHVKLIDLRDFHYGEFSALLPAAEAEEIRYQDGWELLVLIKLFEGMSKDEEISFASDTRHAQLQDALTKYGLMPGKRLDELVATSRSTSFRVGLADFLSIVHDRRWEQSENDLLALLDVLRKTCYGARGPRTHYLAIDGLDHVLITRRIQLQSLMALILAVDRINSRLLGARAPAYVIVLCRTDVFDRLGSPNKNKIRNVHGIELNWYRHAAAIGLSDSGLVRLANLRARVTSGLAREVDVVTECMPGSIRFGESTQKTLITHTRHVPRDYVALLKAIQAQAVAPRVPAKAVNAAITEYSKTYFLGEIKDTMEGFVPSSEIDLGFQLLSVQGRQRFFFSELERAARRDSRYQGIDLIRFCDAAYSASALGNIDDKGIVTFKYRNPAVPFKPDADIIVHAGLLRGLALGHWAESQIIESDL